VQFGGLTSRGLNVLLGTGALLPGACPRSGLKSNGTGTALNGGASPLRSACPSRTPTLPLPHGMGEGWEGASRTLTNNAD
jgi:hypothetical protein